MCRGAGLTNRGVNFLQNKDYEAAFMTFDTARAPPAPAPPHRLQNELAFLDEAACVKFLRSRHAVFKDLPAQAFQEEEDGGGEEEAGAAKRPRLHSGDIAAEQRRCLPLARPADARLPSLRWLLHRHVENEH